MTTENTYYIHIPVKEITDMKDRITKLEEEVEMLKKFIASQEQSKVHPWIIQPDQLG